MEFSLEFRLLSSCSKPRANRWGRNEARPTSLCPRSRLAIPDGWTTSSIDCCWQIGRNSCDFLWLLLPIVDTGIRIFDPRLGRSRHPKGRRENLATWSRWSCRSLPRSDSVYLPLGTSLDDSSGLEICSVSPRVLRGETNNNIISQSSRERNYVSLTHVVFGLSKIINQIFQTHHHFVQIHVLEEHGRSSIHLQRL